ncbi:MAG: hypothetical protein HQL64_07300 [Magnetococcales bacterium]|nr:hypothetical protein [Magnetococcales bacterium]
MPDVYDEAALRHFKDAQLLEKSERLANADQLYGFAAECAIKWVWPGLERSACPHSHVNKLWDQARLSKMERKYPNLYAILNMRNPFSDWSVDQRYEDDHVVSKESLVRHRDMAKRILGSVGLSGKSQDG